MMDSSALRDARDPSRAVTMTTRIIAPVGAFALGAYAENRGYVDAALRKAREMDPTIRTGVDALFAAMRDDARAMTTVESAGSENAIESAMRTMRETLVTMTAPLFATSGREAEATLGGGAGRGAGARGGRGRGGQGRRRDEPAPRPGAARRAISRRLWTYC